MFKTTNSIQTNIAITILIIIFMYYLFYKLIKSKEYFENDQNLINGLEIGPIKMYSNGTMNIDNNITIDTDGKFNIGSTVIDPIGRIIINEKIFQETFNPDLPTINNKTMKSLGLMAYYDHTSLRRNILKDMIGNYDAIARAKLPELSTDSENPKNNYIYGDKDTQIFFPTEILPITYTLFTLAKYNGQTKKTIFGTSNGKQWWSGFRDNNAGIGFQNYWLKVPQMTFNLDSWILSVDKKNFYRANKYNATPGNSDMGKINMAINAPLTYAWGGQQSEFAIKCILVFDQELNIDDISLIEDWIISKYGL